MSAYPELLATRETTLLDLLDTILDKGVVAQGDLTISVADVDLVFVGIKLVLASVETMESWREAAKPIGGNGGNTHEQYPPREEAASFSEPESEGRSFECERPGLPGKADMLRASVSRLPADPDKMEQGLAKLVLTVVELLRRLMERQAIRRMDGGSLTEGEIESMGRAFEKLEQKMEELKAVFGLEREDLNLNLGPLGNLM